MENIGVSSIGSVEKVLDIYIPYIYIYNIYIYGEIMALYHQTLEISLDKMYVIGYE